MEKIKIEKNEELNSILAKLEKTEDSDINLSIAENAIVLQSVINLKILKKRAEELGKSIIIERLKEDGGLEALKSAQDAKKRSSLNNEISQEVSVKNIENRERDIRIEDRQAAASGSAEKVKMFDIVKKFEDRGTLAAQKIEVKKQENTNINIGKSGPDLRKYAPALREDVNIPPKNLQVKKAGKKVIMLPSIMSKAFYAFIFVVVATVLVSAAMTLPKVDIKIKLKSEEMGIDRELKIDDKAEQIDAEKEIIPAKKEEVNGEISETYPTTGKKHIVSKASGKITIYNEYSSSDEKIVATTRFLSKDGKIFRINENVTIPGFKRVEGNDVPGEVTVTVYADEAGEKYNIGPTSFTIPGYQGVRPLKYANIYGRSTEPMTGGADREAMYFSEADYIAAKEKLVKLVKEKNDQEISGKKTDSYLLLDGTKKEDETKISTDVKVGDIADNFKMTAMIKESGLFVNKENIDEIVDWIISAEKNGNVEVLDNSREYGIQAVAQKDDGTTVLPVNIKQYVVAKIDVEKIKKDIANKNEEEVRSYFRNIKEFNSVDVTFSWTQTVPSASEKIFINIEK